MIELRGAIQRGIEGLAREIKGRIPIVAESFGQFRHLILANGVSEISAEVVLEYGTVVTPIAFRDFIRWDSTDATVFSGVSETGRKVVFKEPYNFDRSEDSERRVIRTLITAYARGEELRTAIPGLRVGIRGGRLGMTERDLEDLIAKAREGSIAPYPKRYDPRFDFSVRGFTP